MTDRNGSPSPTYAPNPHAGADQVGSQPSDLGAYLRRVADALAAPHARAEAVLAAAGARDVRLGRDHAYFRPPDARLVRAIVKRTGVADIGAEPGTVSIECDTAGVHVRLAELVAAFGPWTRDTKPTTDIPFWPVRFTTRYQRQGPAEPGSADVVVLASLAADPTDPSAPVSEIVLLRERRDGQD